MLKGAMAMKACKGSPKAKKAKKALKKDKRDKALEIYLPKLSPRPLSEEERRQVAAFIRWVKEDQKRAKKAGEISPDLNLTRMVLQSRRA